MMMMKPVSVFLIFLLFSQAIAETSLSSNAANPVFSMDNESDVVALRKKHHHHNINCRHACERRCKESSRKKVCHRACTTCCKRCNCVPPGTYGNKEACPCYASLRTHGNKPKCP